MSNLHNDIILAEFLDGENIFQRMRSLSPIIESLNLNDDELQSLLIYDFGERLVFDKVIAMNLDLLSNLIVSTNAEKWNAIMLVNGIDFNYDYNKEYTIDTVKTNVNTGANTKTHNVSAFNDDELIADNSDVLSETNTLDSDEKKDYKEKQSTFKTAFNNLQSKTKLNIITTIVSDVANYLTLNIYP